ncbi:hypothetical protein K435DRAFT_804869 [Dendrothele bispora CBS 962.96]|uniref:Uncharacterized protein n=1 Tax=Dendrothele bispora (strain CBS 962.96) TaxID=1314807 RepID=A0A4S8LCZ8_DENBC|nr:hypothetical protein K435DRAFT_804869 [Dendrothele bispora CBS 962.96]
MLVFIGGACLNNGKRATDESGAGVKGRVVVVVVDESWDQCGCGVMRNQNNARNPSMTRLPHAVKDENLSQNILMQRTNLSHLLNPSDTGSQSGKGSFRLQDNAQITNDSEQYMAMQQPPLIQSTITLPQNTTNTKTSNNSKPSISQQIPMYKQDKPVASEQVSSNDGKVMNTYGTANSAQNPDPMRLSLDASNTDVIQIQLYRQVKLFFRNF